MLSSLCNARAGRGRRISSRDPLRPPRAATWDPPASAAARWRPSIGIALSGPTSRPLLERGSGGASAGPRPWALGPPPTALSTPPPGPLPAASKTRPRSRRAEVSVRHAGEAEQSVCPMSKLGRARAARSGPPAPAPRRYEAPAGSPAAAAPWPSPPDHKDGPGLDWPPSGRARPPARTLARGPAAYFAGRSPRRPPDQISIAITIPVIIVSRRSKHPGRPLSSANRSRQLAFVWAWPLGHSSRLPLMTTVASRPPPPAASCPPLGCPPAAR